ncbi:unnamed protein product [Phytophthora fragariaefolia]|uniref:Unnamed protein product n=1 Tax=Phytophthora fragariaefolia TaxID=1490495 RepID=A0A9W7CM91_9STRA|nr:unnamed protein product [Phytophthora fragariaefolia]
MNGDHVASFRPIVDPFSAPFSTNRDAVADSQLHSNSGPRQHGGAARVLGAEPAVDPVQQRVRQLPAVLPLEPRAAVRPAALPPAHGVRLCDHHSASIQKTSLNQRSVPRSSVAQALWVDVTSTSFPQTKLSVSGELPADPRRPAILIANHQVDADWWYIWQAARHQRAAGNVKIVLKDQLKYLPIIGWGMRLFQFLFLRRRIDEDAAHIKQYMGGLIADDFPFWLVLFPEGTTIHAEYVAKSQAFAAREGRPKFERVLLPRTAGMQIILDAVADAKPDIYDLTLAFPSYSGEVPTFDMGYGRKVDTEVPSMKSLLAGKAPVGRVAIHSRKFSYEDAATDLQGFLDARWKEKEERLNYFIEHQKFPGDEGTVDMELSNDIEIQSVVIATTPNL